MKTKKRILSIIMALAMVVTMLPVMTVTANAAGQYVGNRDWKWPVPGYNKISSCFLNMGYSVHANQGGHYALDIPAAKDTAVYSSYPGTVLYVNNSGCTHNTPGQPCSCGDYLGNAVYILHNYLGTTFVSRYGHLTSIKVSSGQQVTKNTVIGTVGTTGSSSGFHLDFTIYHGNSSNMTAWGSKAETVVDPFLDQFLEMPDGFGVNGGATCCYEYVQNAIRQYATPPGYNPEGVLDIEFVKGGAGTVRIRGWAFDRDDPTRSLEIHAYVGGMDVTNGEGHGGIIANGYRDDVGIAYPGVGDYHGYDVTFTTALRGTQPVYVYAINVGGGENKLIGQATVTISDPYHLDVNAYLDGQYYPNSFDTFAKVDVSIGDGAYNYNDVSDYYAAWPDGTTYEVKVQPKDGYVFKGARTGTCEGFIASGLTGTINGGDVYVFLDFETKSCQHNWGRGTVTTAPTCTTAGVRTYTCSLCGETKTESIAALGHNMTLMAGKEPTCTEPGNKQYYTCSRCKGVFKDKAGSTATTVAAMTLPALGHNYENGVCTRCNQPENSNAMKVTVESKKAAAGGTVDVTIQIENNPGIAMTQFKVGFDDALSLQSVDAGSIFSASELTPGATGSNPYTVMFVRTSGNLSEDGTLATLHFKVADTAVEDSVHTVTISGMASDIDEHPITIAFTNGSITIKSVIYGDVNGDEEVNGLDVLRLGKYLTGWNVTIDQDAADVNCDGEINGLDQLRLAKYCTGWPVTLGS